MGIAFLRSDEPIAVLLGGPATRHPTGSSNPTAPRYSAGQEQTTPMIHPRRCSMPQPYENVASNLRDAESGVLPPPPPATPMEGAGASRGLALLEEASSLLDEAEDLAGSVHPVLAALSRHLDTQCATLTVLNRRTSE